MRKAGRQGGWKHLALNAALSALAAPLEAVAVRRVLRTGLFDERWYLESYPDVRAFAPGPLCHYLRHGSEELRQPNPLFDARFYAAANRQVSRSQGSLLIHYHRAGAWRGQDPNPLFDTAWYDRTNPGLRKSGTNPLAHYLHSGAAHGLDPSPFFARNRAARLAGDRLRTPQLGKPLESAFSVVIYTTACGPQARLPDVGEIDPHVRYLAFTDNAALESAVWEVRLLRDALSTRERTAGLPKLLPHRYLPAHDVSIFVNSACDLGGRNVLRVVHDCLREADIGLLANAAGRASGLPTSFIIRRNTREIRTLNEAWWDYFVHEDDAAALAGALAQSPVLRRRIALADLEGFATLRPHALPATPSANAPRLFIFIAYAPAGYNGDLGRAYNDYMEMLESDDYALFLDHDAMFCHPGWQDCILPLLAGFADQDVLFVARTNRIGMAYQRVARLENEHRIAPHSALAAALLENERDWVLDVTQLPPASGVMMMLKKSTWEKNAFAGGFLAVDNRFHRALRAKGGRILMPQAAYVYHFYRADGDETHAVRLPKRIVHAGDDHPVRTFVYDEAAGLSVAAYMDLLSPDGWAIFLRNRSMFGEKHWYGRACEIAANCEVDDVIVFNSNRVHAGSGGSDDMLAHRALAVRLAEAHGAELTSLAEPGPEHFTAFMISKRHYVGLALLAPSGVDGLRQRLQERGSAIHLAQGIYVFSQEEARLGEMGAEAPAAKPQGLDRSGLRVAIIVPWPHEAGMDMAMHDLAEALTSAGDLVTMFSPKPRDAFEEVRHRYMLRRHQLGAEFQEQFLTHQEALPFDVILAEDPGQAAVMALGRRVHFGVPVVVQVAEDDLVAEEQESGGDASLAKILGQADLIVATGEAVAERLRLLCPEASASIVVSEGSGQALAEHYSALFAGLLKQFRVWAGPGRRLV